MKKILYAASFIILLAVTFLAGYWYSHSAPSYDAASGKSKILYYVDPMNPGHRYEKPGIAPCGMALEPVYADGNVARSGMEDVPSGTVMVSPVKQQLLGVRIEPVEKSSAIYTVRLLGKIAADETRVFLVNAGVNGWVFDVPPNTSGSIVKKDQILASFFSEESKNTQQSYINALGSIDRNPSTVRDKSLSTYQTSLQIFYRDALRTIGMGVKQLGELEKTRQIAQYIRITAPASGLIMVRNITPNQWFEKGTELFRIADLNRVWIILDTYENESKYFRPGEKVAFRYQGKTFHARVSNVLPQFDPSTRTLKVRLEADNPGYILRPDMFVDVEHSVTLPPAVTVPNEAVLDSGLKKTVFVERGPGLFIARTVETGRYFDNRVEIVEGLKPGERIVVSGNFLIDSESRMKTASESMSGTGSIDPACGMMVDEGKSKAAGLSSEYQGKTYFFCTLQCKKDFDKAPTKYTGKSADDKSGKKVMENGGHRHD